MTRKLYTSNVHSRINALTADMKDYAARHDAEHARKAALDLVERFESEGATEDLKADLQDTAQKIRSDAPMIAAFMDIIAYNCDQVMRQQRLFHHN